ncbi:MAG: hypothetical protein OXC18_18470 [Desulfurellaceae bacterium]|nr:hypothetical protein [Desulfurellaceae bacterium]
MSEVQVQELQALSIAENGELVLVFQDEQETIWEVFFPPGRAKELQELLAAIQRKK